MLGPARKGIRDQASRQPVDTKNLITMRPDQTTKNFPRPRIDGMNAAFRRPEIKSRRIGLKTRNDARGSAERNIAAKRQAAGPARQLRPDGWN